MFRRISLLSLILALFVPVRAIAQESQVALNTLEIDLWPEYDRPGILVIYNATLPAEVTLPVEITFRIPSAAGEPNGVAYPVEGQSKPLTLPYTRKVTGERALITFTASTPEFLLEYYDPALEKAGEARHFVYHWVGDYAVNELTVRVQQPVGATDMRTSPSIEESVRSQQGLLYYTKKIGSLSAGQTFDISIDYLKTTDALSVESFQVEPSYPVSPETTGRFSLKGILPWLLGALGAVLVVGGGWWYLQSGRGEQVEVGRRRRKTAPSQEEVQAVGEGVYCHQCGKRASSGDRYCRSCGTRLRTES